MIEYTVTCMVGGRAVLCDMKFDEENPAELQFTFHTEENRSPVWIFSRDLVKQVFIENGVSGHGDVVFYDHGDAISMLMRSPEGTGMALFEHDVLRDFVDAIYKQVESDDMNLDDDVLDEWLKGLV